MANIGNQAQAELVQNYQKTSQQLEMVENQLRNLSNDITDLTNTIKSLESLSKEEEVYKRVGKIHFIDKAGKVLDDKRDKLELRKLNEKRLKRQQEKLQESLNEFRAQLEQMIGQQRPSN